MIHIHIHPILSYPITSTAEGIDIGVTTYLMGIDEVRKYFGYMFKIRFAYEYWDPSFIGKLT